jgi:pyruvate kinase
MSPIRIRFREIKGNDSFLRRLTYCAKKKLCPHCSVRKTKIIATLGPATETPETLSQLIRTGVNIFRLNMSHATHEWVRAIVPRIRQLADEQNRSVGILMDTQGPAIRTGDLPTKLQLKVGETFTFTVRGHKSEEEQSVDTNYDDLVKDIQVGDVVMVDNGVIQMVVKSKNEFNLRCEVLTAGQLGSRRHINLPGVKVNLPSITEKDLADIKVGIEIKVDFIALSFVREANDISMLRQILESDNASHIKIVAKIEDQSAVHKIDEIVAATDAIMVARGDLGIEWPYEELPIIQRRIVKKCIQTRTPVIVATHMLESMIESPMPTRAEITDVANAVFEGTDAIMLSGETTVGRYPIRCVEVLDKVARRIERSGSIGFHQDIVLTDDRDKVASSAVHMANQTKADGLCVFTHTGHSARLCAALRPESTPIFAFTPDEALCHQLSLNHAVRAMVLPFKSNPQDTIAAAEELLLKRHWVTEGNRLVVLSDLQVKDKTIWSVQMRSIGKA